MSERRLSLTVRTRVVWDGGVISGYSTDVSEQGIFVETNRALATGTQVRVEFSLTRQGSVTRIVVEGRVVCAYSTGSDEQCSPIAGLGIHFDDFVFGEEDLTHYVTDQMRAVKAMSAALDAERRASPRVTVGFPVFWGPSAPPDREAFLANLSSTGCLVLGAAEPVGTPIHLWFEYPSEGTAVSIRLAATVARVIPARGDLPTAMGLKFDTGALEAEQLASLAQFVTTRVAWQELLVDLPSGKGGWPDFARGEELPPLNVAPPSRLPNAQALEALGMRPKVIYRMLIGTLSMLGLLLIIGVLIYLRLACSGSS